ncbi:HAD family hydrolase [Yersinia enterocolitica]|uniref:HAD family hydrolase n=1 Tax=Yersinia enterocolitica TaxID=630 RepID=UPI001C60D6AB|nr:HAD-IA family hydrolase [Yersinia enterocolitica]EKN5078462.1 HAD family hydrolase [Yersinia enterocolitica]EKN5090007.1 HAD family hydrolase [Yersinia enterocolitica]EKN6366150.1 HAD family hydrolase [Yersinia enterocolitica]MBW5847035.1 HAD family hydrolase [Yersinia enterocolitica]MBW5864435.1 HAD family hydrolase [Yersinia enterocolitica]
MKKTVLITDLDNTLFDWFSVWYHSFNAMLNKTVEISGFSKDFLIEQIKPIHQKHGTAEYSFLLEEIPALREKYGDRDTINSTFNEAIHAYRSERKKYLKLYPSVMETLVELKGKGVMVIGYTESKEYYSNFRIHRLGLDGVIDVLFSPQDHEIPESVEKQTNYQLSHTINKHTPVGEIKPNPEILLDIIKTIKADVNECVYIGDSEMKDIAMAQTSGVTDVFAKYGTGHFSDNIEGYELLRAVTHWTEADVERERAIKEHCSVIKPSYIAEKFSDLIGFFEFTKFKG